jgi:UDP-N-acetylglucosamine 4,6-dehydratase/5-epimerase
MNWSEQVVLVTGGTGSIGKRFVEIMLREYCPKKIIVFSRDELKQHKMRTSGLNDVSLRYFIGDVRDPGRLSRAFSEVTVVVHAAALKHVGACEYNPFEAIQTNIMGGQHVIDAAITHGVQRTIAVSTDKAVNPNSLYGATKLCAEKMFVRSNNAPGSQHARFSCVRLGNLLASRGSVVTIFRDQRKSGKITITDPRMTRFSMTLDDAARFLIQCLEVMRGGEIFVPKIPSMRLTDLASTVAPDCEYEITGMRQGEKLHEALISEDEARVTTEAQDMYIIEPGRYDGEHPGAYRSHLPDGFRYTSDLNEQWLTCDELKMLLHRDETIASARAPSPDGALASPDHKRHMETDPASVGAADHNVEGVAWPHSASAAP